MWEIGVRSCLIGPYISQCDSQNNCVDKGIPKQYPLLKKGQWTEGYKLPAPSYSPIVDVYSSKNGLRDKEATRQQQETESSTPSYLRGYMRQRDSIGGFACSRHSIKNGGRLFRIPPATPVCDPTSKRVTRDLSYRSDSGKTSAICCRW